MSNSKIIFIIFIFISFPLYVSAQRELEVPLPRELEVPLPPEFEKTPLLEEYIEDVFNFALMISGFIVFGVLVYGGIRYLTSRGSPAAMADAIDWILGGFLGFIILIASYIILTTINPELWLFKAPEMEGQPAEPKPTLPLCFNPYELRKRGDVTKDCIIDILDLTTCGAASLPECDLNNDGEINEEDLKIIQDHYNVKCCGPSGLTPGILAAFGDFVEDCEIDIKDVASVGKAVGSENGKDLNRDGIIDECDLSIISTTFYHLKCGDLLTQELLARLGDVNGNCVIDIADLVIISRSFGTGNESLDLNKDGVVDECDLSIPGEITWQFNCVP